MKFVRIIALWIVAASACRAGSESSVSEVGRVRTKSLNEASGLVTSHKYAGVYWTHNDGDDGVLYALSADGSAVGKVKVDAKFRDFEDIASDGDGNLYLADVGNNDRNRKHVVVYKVAEPDPKAGGKIEVIGTWKLTFPADPFNCESLFVHGGNGYLISKVNAGEQPSIYRFALTPTRRPRPLERVCDLPIKEPVTAADISPDGNRLAVLSQRTLSVFTIDGDVKTVASATPLTFSIPPIQAEGCCFNDAGVLVIAESGEILQTKLDPATTAPTTQAAR